MRRQAFTAIVLCAPLLAGCGTVKQVDLARHSRVAAPVHVSVYAGDRRVLVAPRSVGSGPVTFDVTNQASRRLTLGLAGSGGGCLPGSSGPLASGQTGQFTVDLRTGSYSIGPCHRGGAPGAAGGQRRCGARVAERDAAQSQRQLGAAAALIAVNS